MEENNKKKKTSIFFRNYAKDGKGVKKEDVITEYNFINFFKLYARKFSKLVYVNFLYIFGNFPILFFLLGISGYFAAKANTPGELGDGTYEAIGPNFNSNPHRLEADVLVRHGQKIIPLAERTFDCIREYLAEHNIEGIVFWKDGQPRCKIKRKDFGYMWPSGE